MGSKKKLRRQQRQQEKLLDDKVEEKAKAKNSKQAWVIVSVVIILTIGVFAWKNTYSYFSSTEEVKQNRDILCRPIPQVSDENKSAFAKFADITTDATQLVIEKPNDPLNLARINLMCAQGLPYSQDINIDKCLDVLKQMAARVKSETKRYLYKYKASPKDYYNSEAYFRMLALITVLQQDFGIKYNPSLIKYPPSIEDLKKPFTEDSRNVFLHGLLTGQRQGTCASMPVLYLIVGRMLGYPLKLVRSKAHLFLRWDDRSETINLEATNKGLAIHPDSFYKKFPFTITPEEEKYNYFLLSMSPKEELAAFLEIRAGILKEMGRFREMVALYRQILQLTPNHPFAKRYIAYFSSASAIDMAMKIQKQRQLIQQKRLESIALINSELVKLNNQLLNNNFTGHITAVPANVNKRYDYNQIRVKRSEIEHQRRLRNMVVNELLRWKNKMQNDVGSPVTIEQIHVLLSPSKFTPPPLPKGYLERQRQIKYQRFRNLPNSKRHIARLQETERLNRMRQEVIGVRARIIAANNLRRIAEGQQVNLKKVKIVK